LSHEHPFVLKIRKESQKKSFLEKYGLGHRYSLTKLLSDAFPQISSKENHQKKGWIEKEEHQTG
jgi:hypothetical protein